VERERVLTNMVLGITREVTCYPNEPTRSLRVDDAVVREE
jgi:hypothetical protein